MVVDVIEITRRQPVSILAWMNLPPMESYGPARCAVWMPALQAWNTAVALGKITPRYAGKGTALRAADFVGNRSTIGGSAASMAGPFYCENVFQTRKLRATMKAKLMGMLWTMPPGWLDRPTGATWQVLEAPSEGHLGVGEGPAEAIAEAKQESMAVKRKQFVSEQWILSCESLGRPLVILVLRRRAAYTPL